MIKYDLVAIEQLSQDITKFANEMENDLSDLYNQFRRTLTDWTGKAAEACDSAQAEWKMAADSIREGAAGLAPELLRASEEMGRLDQAYALKYSSYKG